MQPPELRHGLPIRTPTSATVANKHYQQSRIILPPCTVFIPCIIAEKAIKMARFS